MAFRAVISGVSSGLALAQHHLKGAVAGVITRRANLLHSHFEQFPRQVYFYPRFSIRKFNRLPPLEKGDRGGFYIHATFKSPLTPLLKGGNARCNLIYA